MLTGLRMNATKLLQDLVRIDSRSPGELNAALAPDAVTEETLAQWVAERLQSIGFACDLQPAAPRRPNLIAWSRRNPAWPALAFQAHFDTVGSDGMTIPPFAAEIRAGRLYGRGAADTKGSIAAMLAALARLQAMSVPLNLGFLGTAAEETGCEGVRELDLTGMPVDGIIVGEPTSNQPVTGHKAHLWFELTCHGRAAHGSSPEAGDNAIYRMTEVIAVLRKVAQTFTAETPVPGFTPSTLSVDVIRGGTKVNIIPDACSVQVDVRLQPRLAPVVVLEHLLREAGAAAGGKLALTWTHITPGFETPSDSRLIRALCTGLEQTGLAPNPGTVSYCTDGGVLKEKGYDVVVFGPGSILQAHSADEFIELAELDQAVEILVHTAQAFATGG